MGIRCNPKNLRIVNFIYPKKLPTSAMQWHSPLPIAEVAKRAPKLVKYTDGPHWYRAMIHGLDARN